MLICVPSSLSFFNASTCLTELLNTDQWEASTEVHALNIVSYEEGASTVSSAFTVVP